MKNPCIISFYMNNIDPRTVQLQRAVVTPPTVTVISAEFQPKSLQVDEAIVVQEIIQKAMPSLEQNGKELAQNMAVQTIAEKKLIEHLRIFFKQKKDVKTVPDMTVTAIKKS